MHAKEGDWCDAPARCTRVRFGIDSPVRDQARERRRALPGWPSLGTRPRQAQQGLRVAGARAKWTHCTPMREPVLLGHRHRAATRPMAAHWSARSEGGIACNSGWLWRPLPWRGQAVQVRTDAEAGAPARKTRRGEGSDQLGWRALCPRKPATAASRAQVAGALCSLDGRFTYREDRQWPPAAANDQFGFDPAPPDQVLRGAAAKRR